MKALALALSVLFAQSPYVETFEVRVQSLDVIVTDKKGNPVGGLTKDDFVVLDAGVVQEVSNFSAYRESAGSVSAKPGAIAPVAASAEPPPPRKLVFFLDELSLHPVSRNKILRGAMQLVESLGERDEAMVVTALGPDNVVQPLTADRAAIRAALEKTLGHSDFRGNLQPMMERRNLETEIRLSSSKPEILNARRRYANAVKRRVEQRLGSLSALVASLAGLEGKKVLVVMTSSLSAMPGLEEAAKEKVELVESFSRPVADGPVGAFVGSDAGASTIRPLLYDLRPLIEDLGRTAAASGVTIYPLQPDVPLELLAPGAVGTRRNTRYNGAESYASTLQNNEMTMVSLAETTGGRWFRGDGRIHDVFRQVESDVRAYYSLGYHVKDDRDRARRVEVRVKNRPELTVRTRRDVLEKSTTREMTDLTMAALLYTHPVNELGITAEASRPRRVRDTFSIPVEVRIPMEKLTFLPSGEGQYQATFHVHYAVSGAQRDFVAGEERKEVVNLTDAQFRALAGKIFRYTSDIRIAKGNYRVAVGVLDATSRLSGFQTVTVSTNAQP